MEELLQLLNLPNLKVLLTIKSFNELVLGKMRLLITKDAIEMCKASANLRDLSPASFLSCAELEELGIYTPSLEEVNEYAKVTGAKHAKEWHKLTIANNSRDNRGNPIRNWRKAFDLFEKYMSSKEVDNA